MVAEYAPVATLGGLIQLNAIILDGGRLELLGDALFYAARGLPYLEKPSVRYVVNRVRVDARPGFRLWR
jgi:hypothetical protein